MNRAFEITRTIMDAVPVKQVLAMFPRDEELSELVDDQVVRGATRVFIADAAIPEEIVKLTGDFVADYQTKVPSPDILTRTAFRGTPNPGDLLEGDVIYSPIWRPRFHGGRAVRSRHLRPIRTSPLACFRQMCRAVMRAMPIATSGVFLVEKMRFLAISAKNKLKNY